MTNSSTMISCQENNVFSLFSYTPFPQSLIKVNKILNVNISFNYEFKIKDNLIKICNHFTQNSHLNVDPSSSLSSRAFWLFYLSLI